MMFSIVSRALRKNKAMLCMALLVEHSSAATDTDDRKPPSGQKLPREGVYRISTKQAEQYYNYERNLWNGNLTPLPQAPDWAFTETSAKHPTHLSQSKKVRKLWDRIIASRKTDSTYRCPQIFNAMNRDACRELGRMYGLRSDECFDCWYQFHRYGVPPTAEATLDFTAHEIDAFRYCVLLEIMPRYIFHQDDSFPIGLMFSDEYTSNLMKIVFQQMRQESPVDWPFPHNYIISNEAEKLSPWMIATENGRHRNHKYQGFPKGFFNKVREALYSENGPLFSGLGWTQKTWNLCCNDAEFRLRFQRVQTDQRANFILEVVKATLPSEPEQKTVFLKRWSKAICRKIFDIPEISSRKQKDIFEWLRNEVATI